MTEHTIAHDYLQLLLQETAKVFSHCDGNNDEDYVIVSEDKSPWLAFRILCSFGLQCKRLIAPTRM